MSDNVQRTIRIKWIRSGIGFTYHQKHIVRSLGLRKLNQEVERPDTPQIRGLVAKVPHLLGDRGTGLKPAWHSTCRSIRSIRRLKRPQNRRGGDCRPAPDSRLARSGGSSTPCRPDEGKPAPARRQRNVAGSGLPASEPDWPLPARALRKLTNRVFQRKVSLASERTRQQTYGNTHRNTYTHPEAQPSGGSALVRAWAQVMARQRPGARKDSGPERGARMRPGFEGGQMPLQRRLPKRGFTNIFKKHFALVNLRDLEDFTSGESGDSANCSWSGVTSRIFKMA